MAGASLSAKAYSEFLVFLTPLLLYSQHVSEFHFYDVAVRCPAYNKIQNVSARK